MGAALSLGVTEGSGMDQEDGGPSLLQVSGVLGKMMTITLDEF